MRKKLTRNTTRERNLEEIERLHNQLKKFDSTPDVQVIQDAEVVLINDNGTRYLGIRDGDTVYKVEVS